MNRKFRSFIRRLRGEDRAAAMVEFAIIAPLLFTLVFGIIDFGRAFLLYTNLTNVVRETARLGAVQNAPAFDSLPLRISLRNRLNAVSTEGDSGLVRITNPGVAPNRTVFAQISNFPFRPASFFVLRRIPRLTVRAEFLYEGQ
jgi:Flp pilus assembly pilin Flp